jgi:hypothetical protein
VATRLSDVTDHTVLSNSSVESVTALRTAVIGAGSERDDHDVQFSVDHQRRFGALFTRAKSLTCEGTVGDLRCVEFAEVNLFDARSHQFGLAGYFATSRPSSGCWRTPTSARRASDSAVGLALRYRVDVEGWTTVDTDDNIHRLTPGTLRAGLAKLDTAEPTFVPWQSVRKHGRVGFPLEIDDSPLNRWSKRPTQRSTPATRRPETRRRQRRTRREFDFL